MILLFSEKNTIFSRNLEFAMTPPPPDIFLTPVSLIALTKMSIKESTIASWYDAAKSFFNS